MVLHAFKPSIGGVEVGGLFKTSLRYMKICIKKSKVTKITIYNKI